MDCCISPVSPTIIFQIHTELLLHVIFSLLFNKFCVIPMMGFKQVSSYIKYDSIFMYRYYWNRIKQCENLKKKLRGGF